MRTAKCVLTVVCICVLVASYVWADACYEDDFQDICTADSPCSPACFDWTFGPGCGGTDTMGSDDSIRYLVGEWGGPYQWGNDAPMDCINTATCATHVPDDCEEE
jgi:hypothetical protein